MRVQEIVERLQANGVRAGYPQFAWWIPLGMYSTTCGAILIAVAQRVGTGHVLPTALLLGLTTVPWLAGIVGPQMKWYVALVVGAVPTGFVMWAYPVPYDFAMLSMVMLVGHWGAKETLRDGLAATALLTAGFLVLCQVADLPGSAFWLAGLVVGWDIGFILQHQQRRIDAQDRAASDQQAQAVLEERQRIAREVHDVVAHSLSVTMLHLTAARRSLEQDDDVTEAVEALRDAERTGRQAMADIRQTVGMLGTTDATGGAGAQAARSAADVPELVEQFAAAGLAVTLEVDGDLSEVPATAGLGLYRIVQESLTNVAKHAPRSQCTVDLEVRRHRQAVRVANTLTGPVVPRPGGSGVGGMQQRAESLAGSFSAGPDDGRWVVAAVLPASSARECRLVPLRGLLPSPARPTAARPSPDPA